MFGLLPVEEVMLWGILVSVSMAAVYRVFIKPSEMASIKRDLDFFKKKISAANKIGDTKKSQELLGEMMKVNQKMFQKNMKPMMVSMIVAVIILGLIGQEHTAAVIHLPFNVPFAGTELTWLWWYILVTLPFSMFFRKIAGVE